MMILSVLKVIGIVIGGIAGLVLLLFLALLLVPVRYRIVSEKDTNSMRICGKADWMAGLVSAAAEYQEEKFAWAIRLFGIRIFPRKERMTAGDQKPGEHRSKEQKPGEHKPNEQRPKEHKPKGQKLRDRLKAVSDMKGRQLKQTILSLLRHVKPRRIAGEIRIGLESPDQTALVYGVTANLAALLDRHLLIIPEMDGQKLEFDLMARGRIFPGYVAVLALRLRLDPQVRTIIQKSAKHLDWAKRRRNHGG